MNHKFFEPNSFTTMWQRLRRTLVRLQYYSAKTPVTLFSLSVFLFIIFLCSCEKVIDVNINNAGKMYVIEGNVSNLLTEQPEVKISQTKNFEENNTFNGIAGAVVTIQVNNGVVYPLTQASPGIYRSNAFTGAPGNNYKLSVTINGNNYTATCIMPAALVKLDTLTVEDLSFAGNTTKTIQPSYLDPNGKGNSYRLMQYINGKQVKKIFVQNDDLSDGLRITRPLINFDDEIKSGDVVKVNLQCIDANVYKFWYSLDQEATGENQSATPANPVNNISGNALGYFSAHSVSSFSISVP
jgi:Domain of unknown function (DUF4249)